MHTQLTTGFTEEAVSQEEVEQASREDHDCDEINAFPLV